MYRGSHFKNFTYGADGGLMLNTENRWGNSIHTNYAEHFDHKKQLETFENVAKEAEAKVEYFQAQTESQQRQIEYFQNQQQGYENFINRQSNAYNQALTQNENVINQQQRAIEYFKQVQDVQNQANLKIAEQHMELVKSHPEFFTVEGFESQKPVFSSQKTKCAWKPSSEAMACSKREECEALCAGNDKCYGFAQSDNKWYMFDKMDEGTCQKGSKEYEYFRKDMASAQPSPASPVNPWVSAKGCGQSSSWATHNVEVDLAECQQVCSGSKECVGIARDSKTADSAKGKCYIVKNKYTCADNQSGKSNDFNTWWKPQ